MRSWQKIGLVAILICGQCASARKTAFPVLRWVEGAACCSLRQGEDGRTYYRVATSEFEVTLGVDSRELEKLSRRATPMLAVLLDFRLLGNAQLRIQRDHFALEFVKHSQVIKTSLEPNDLLREIQENAEDLTHQVERHEIPKHPKLKDQKEAELQERLKDYTEMTDFISTRALHSTTLSPAKSSISGWVFFSVKDRWIGPWRKPEQFVLSLPLGGLSVEFPFSLPPQSEKLELRRRSQQ